MTRFFALAVISLASTVAANAQGRPLDWPFYAGDAQRTGWEKSDLRITKENVKDFQLVLKRKFENNLNGPRSLTPPVVIGNLISYRGFKELAFVTGNSGNIWSIDADTDRIFWKKRFDSEADKPKSSQCSAAVTVTPSLTPPTNFAARPRPVATPAAPANPARPMLGAPTFGSPRPAFAVSSDGKLHVLNTSNGDDLITPANFLPANAKASSLIIAEGVIYTTTTAGCGSAPNAVWAIDLNSADNKVASFELKSGSPSSLGGLALGTDGTVFVQSANKVLALAPKTLELKQTFTGAGAHGQPTTPVVFTYKDRDMVVASTEDKRLYLLDAAALETPLYQTPPIATGGQGISGGLSTWQDADGVRWILAPVWGPHGSIVAFKLEEVDGKPVLTKAWTSREMDSPLPPVITGGVVFALATGGSGSHATLYALDGGDGKEMYSTGNQVTAPGNLTGITLANGRVYFTTNDSTLYAFGIYLER